jgi:hypothetical protein
MRRTLSLAFACLLVLCLLQAGCEKRTAGPVITDWDAVKQVIAQYPSIFRLGFFDVEPDTESFYREITSSYADIRQGEFHDADPDYITLTWSDSLIGRLHYDSSGQSHQKPIVFKTQSEAYFERWGNVNDPNLGWLLRGISGTMISSTDGSREIDELHIVSEGIDTFIYQPGMAVLVNKDSTIEFGRGKLVTFIVEPADSTDSLFLHVKEGEMYKKIPFEREGEGSFSASWITIQDPGPGRYYYHVIIDLVSQESLAADSTDYDAAAWGIVYRVE